MKQHRVPKTAVAAVLSFILLVGIVSCGEKTKETSDTSDTSESESAVITEMTTTLTDYSGPLPSNDVAVSWQETEIDETVRYAYVSDGNFLRVRSGPGTDYDIVATLTSDMQVVVVAVTSNGWYKLSDGFYVSGDFLTETPSSP